MRQFSGVAFSMFWLLNIIEPFVVVSIKANNLRKVLFPLPHGLVIIVWLPFSNDVVISFRINCFSC
ncbi:hypothetical protein BCR24_10745 [Enterococcus ureilyticus]|uniref:Uncharacterized protein n=1 Tax=Enterococcus ureilyticus TaxID=1131292 RepID=A0A1E5HEY2_9ENTE|nr:hypothetical protein BCR24_10745 [Enterococcus ureilyticus]